MRQGIVPNQELVEIEMYILTQLFNRLPIDVVEVDFPQFLDQQNLDQRQHDFVFVRDLFISNQKGEIIISKFSEKARQVESDIMEVMLDSMGYKTVRIPETINATAEGGEFYYCSGQKILFSGACRNNIRGAEWVAQEFNVNELIILKSNVFHLDTLFTPVIDKKNKLRGVVACTELMEKDSKIQLKDFTNRFGIDLVEVDVGEIEAVWRQGRAEGLRRELVGEAEHVEHLLPAHGGRRAVEDLGRRFELVGEEEPHGRFGERDRRAPMEDHAVQLRDRAVLELEHQLRAPPQPVGVLKGQGDVGLARVVVGVPGPGQLALEVGVLVDGLGEFGVLGFVGHGATCRLGDSGVYPAGGPLCGMASPPGRLRGRFAGSPP